jgi:fatty acid desaturase
MFRHAADRLPVFLFCCLFVVDLSVYALVDAWWLLVAYAVISIVPKAGACAFNHHHQHVSTFTSPLPNRLLELMYALQTGVSANAWVLHHSLGHHVNYLDQTKDESRWMRADGARMGEWEYGLVTTLTAYPRAWRVGAGYPRQRRVFLVMGLLTLATMAGLVAWRPLPGLVLFVGLPLFLLFGTAFATWAHHSNRGTESHFVASNNILQPFYNALTGNLGYHTAHHYKPGVHWSQLVDLHAQIEPKIPAAAYLEPGWPWRLAGPSPKPRVTADEGEGSSRAA